MSLGRLFMMSDPAKKVPLALELVFPKEYLESRCEDDPRGRTYREIQEEVKFYRFPREDKFNSRMPQY